MLLLVGLGNPGDKYANNRHNVGFMALDEIVRRHSFSPWRQKFQGQVCEGQIDGIKVIALKPETFMNESGRSVVACAHFYKIEPEDIIVFHDELDVAFTKLKVKTGGGHGGHNGLRSIDSHIGKNYVRVRIGIDHPGSKEKVHGHVLGDYAKAQLSDLERSLEAVAKNIGVLLQGDQVAFMNKYATLTQPQRENKPKPINKNAETSGGGVFTKVQQNVTTDHPFAALKKLKDQGD
mgnify:CR=1 FL=1